MPTSSMVNGKREKRSNNMREERRKGVQENADIKASTK